MFGLSRTALIEMLVAMGEQRATADASPTLYVQNMGSSGSHWLSAMLGIAFGAFPGGETYLPQQLLQAISQLPKNENRATVVQSVMLAHTMNQEQDPKAASIVNTAHIHDISTYAEHDLSSFAILLLRNPVDVVLSRTFRKSEYRNFLGQAEVNDADFAATNIEYVTRFLESAVNGSHDLVIRYEDMLERPRYILQQVANVLGTRISAESADAAIEKTRVHENGNGTTIATNAFSGQKQPIPADIEAMVRDKLSQYCEASGYSS